MEQAAVWEKQVGAFLLLLKFQSSFIHQFQLAVHQ